MVQRNYLRVLSLLLIIPLLLLISACSSWPKLRTIEIQTVEVERVIPTVNRPRPINMNDIKFYVVTIDTFEEFKIRFEKDNGQFLFYAISVRDYETLALNMADIKRYVIQQKQIIIYYEKALSPKEEEKEK